MSRKVFFCPDCRNRVIRRRKRTSIALWVASWFGRWPYHCEECGSDFLLEKRYLRPRDREGHLLKPAARRTQPELSVPVLDYCKTVDSPAQTEIDVKEALAEPAAET